MPFSPADSSIFAPLFGDAATAAIFSDEQFARCMLDVEAALARVEAQLGVIPAEAAQRIDAASQSPAVDLERLSAGTQQDGFPVVELVRQLRAWAGGEAAGYVHWGATTQDIMDTALVLQLRAALDGLEENLAQVIGSLAALADRHRRTLLAGRTHSQQALPITFGFKVANWLAPLLRHRQRLGELKPRLLVVQFGGAAGTLAALGDSGLAVQAALAAELGLGVLPMPWHTQRDNLAEFAGWLSLVSGSLAKMAQDVILLAQSEIAEVREAGGARGGSSTMPQKNNPVTSEYLVAAARANAALLASMHQALPQENERATGAWQIEWLTLPQMLGLTAGALQKARFLSENLVVDAARMAANVRASNGLMLAEGFSFLLAPTLGREEAKELVRRAAQTARSEGRRLADVLREMNGAPPDWPSLQDEADYLGAAEAFIDRVLDAASG